MTPMTNDRLTLALDASTYAGSVAVLRGATLVAERTIAMRGEREERLMPAVVDALTESGASASDIALIVCGAGPGSFTSLRIAGAIAKGMATAVGCPLVAVPSLALAVAGSDATRVSGRYLAVLDAMRGDRYVALYDVTVDGTIEEQEPARLVPASEVPTLATVLQARIVGAGESIDAAPHARGVARLGNWLDRFAPVDLEAWEPRYGRAAEAQVQWERTHGRPLPAH
jgi:tRNA threonylcarbamoyladenosine biosynthesis protein TsaB